MTEFMTQRELANEFLLFLEQYKDMKKQFLEDIKYGYPQATPYNVGGKKLATFASVGDDPIKYIMEMSKKDKIINKFGTNGQLLSDIPFTIVLPLFGFQHNQHEFDEWSRINKKFKKYYIENIKNGND